MDEHNISDDAAGMPQPRLIPHVISERVKNTPQKIWASLPLSPSDASQGYEDISFTRLNYAVSRAARWLVANIEQHRTKPFEALAYIGPPDSRYVIFAIAAIKAGFQMLFLSPRNSDEAQYSVLRQADCHKFLCSDSMEPRVQKLIQDRPGGPKTACYVVPEQEWLLEDDFVPEFPYDRTLEQARSEPLVILHTSSTTGIPKTIALNQGYGLHEDIVQHVPKFDGLDIITRSPFYGACRMFVAMPLFHAGGVLLTLLKSLYHDIVSVFQPPSVPLSSEVFDAILRHGNCNGCVIPPYLLEDMLAVPSYFDTLANMKFVQFGSGPLSKAAGDSLLTRQKACPHYIGSSECGLFLLLELDDPVADWQYFRFHPWSGVDMRPLQSDGSTCELFIVRSKAPNVPGMQPVFELFPDLTEWPTRDLYVQHPTKKDHWRCIGRNDDVLVLSNGEKLNPVDTEGRLTGAHSLISGALVIGQGQFAPGLLLEVRDVDTTDLTKRSKLIEEIWPLVEAANKQAPGHGKIMKSLVLFTSAGKPFLRTPKLSIRRKPTVDAYAEEILSMYQHYNSGTEDSEVVHPSQADFSSVNGIRAFLLDSIQMVTGWESQLSTQEDLFMHGMDSLQAVRIAHSVKRVFKQLGVRKEFSPRVIYSHPTITALSNEIYGLVNKSDTHGSATQIVEVNEIERSIQKYSDFDSTSLPQQAQPENEFIDSRTPIDIILTGSTGSLGSYLLSNFLSNPRVGHIYCLNRSKDARKRQLDAMAAQGMDKSKTLEFDSRVHFLHTTDLGAPELGLNDSKSYSSLQKGDITHIVHNAWPVNFNLSLASFGSHIAGVRNLIDFCISAPQPPRLFFISSLSSVTNLSTATRVPEAVVTDTSAPSRMGYGESKFVAERILNMATEASNGILSTSILRIGQIAGPVKGGNTIWPVREWFPSLVISSKSIGALPESLGRMNNIDWVPIDLLADSIDELLMDDIHGSKINDAGTPLESNVYHVLNPHTIDWGELLPAVEAKIKVGRTVALRDWIEMVRQGPDETSSGNPNPAKKILQFYEALAAGQDSWTVGNTNGVQPHIQRFEVAKMAKRSTTFREMGPVKGAWISSWVANWI